MFSTDFFKISNHFFKREIKSTMIKNEESNTIEGTKFEFESENFKLRTAMSLFTLKSSLFFCHDKLMECS